MSKQNTFAMVAGFRDEFAACWRKLPNKGFFFALLAAWLALFQFLGNSIFGYVDTPSLFMWLNHVWGDAIFEDGHGQWIPLVVLALFWWKRRELLAQPLRESWLGVVILAGAGLLHIVGYLSQQPQISVVALFTGIYGLMGMAWGRGWLRKSFFPFFLFAFCVPLRSFGDNITFPMRILATQISVATAHLFGLDVIRDGTQIFNAQRTFNYDVAPACGGIRSLVALLALTTIYGFVLFRSGGKRLALIAAAFPLAVAGNVLRLVLIIFAAEKFGQKAGNYVHDNAVFSLLPYVPAIAGLLVLTWWLRKIEDTNP